MRWPGAERVRAWLAACLIAGAPGAFARQSVTFVLADPQRSAFFDAAAAYYAAADTALVTSARSLADVREFLARSPLRGAQPWGEVRLVAHGSPWYGLRVPIYGDGEMSRLSALEREHDSGAFPALPAEVLDGASRIAIESCGVARRPALLRAIGRLFSGGAAPAIAGRDYVEFRRPLAEVRGAVERREVPYVARVEAGVSGDASAVDARLRAQWRREQRDEPRGLERRSVPVELSFPLVDGARASPTTMPAVRAMLHDLGLAARDLAWRERDGMLVGEGRIEVLAPPLAGEAVAPAL